MVEYNNKLIERSHGKNNSLKFWKQLKLINQLLMRQLAKRINWNKNKQEQFYLTVLKKKTQCQRNI
mgnify:CR=1 FL=1